MDENKTPSGFPLSNWVSLEVIQSVKDHIQRYARTAGSSNEVIAEGIENSRALRDIYLNEYLIVYTLRTHPLFMAVINDARAKTDIHNGGGYHNKELYWRDECFSGEVIKNLVSGLISFPGIEFIGELRDELVIPLLSLTPPMQQEIATLLHNKILYLVESKTLSLVTEVPGEIFTSAVEMALSLVNQKSTEYVSYYAARFNSRSIHHLSSSMPDYDLWYSERGNAVMVTALLDQVGEKITRTVNGTLQIMYPGYEVVEKAGLEIAENKYNDTLGVMQYYWEQLDFNTITDGFINERLQDIAALTINGVSELTAEQRTVSGHMMVKSEYKFLKSFTMREIAMGLPQRDATIFNSVSYDYEGTQKKLHSETFEKMIRSLPDKLESFLVAKSEAVEQDPAVREKLRNYYKIAVQMVLEGFMLNVPEIEWEDFKDAIAQYLTAAAPSRVVNINHHECCDMICINGRVKEGKERLLFVSVLTGECRIMAHNIDLIRNNIKFKAWLLKHLNAAERLDVDIDYEFDAYKLIIVGQQVLRVPNGPPLVFLHKEDCLDELCSRYARKIKSDADSLIKTSAENAAGYILDFVTITLSALTVVPARTALGFILQFIIGAAGITTAKVLRFYHDGNSDNDNIAFWNVMKNLILSLVFNASAVVRVLKNQIKLQVLAKTVSHSGEVVKKLQRYKTMSENVDESYRTSQNMLAEGAMSKVYTYDAEYLIKDYKKLLQDILPRPEKFGENLPRTGKVPIYNNSLIEANNSAVALNRLYGKGSASVIMFNGPDIYSKSVSLKMKRMSGVSLTTVLKNKDPQVIQRLSSSLSEVKISQLASEILQDLKEKGITHHDINLSNIIFDFKKDKYALVDFDSAVINPVRNNVIEPLTVDKYSLMMAKLIGDLRECARRCHDIIHH